MTETIVLDFSSGVKNSVALYSRGLVDTTGKKTCAEMARYQRVNYRRMLGALSKSNEEETISYITSTQRKELRRRMRRNPNGTFVLDDGGIMKIYADEIEGMSIIRDGATGMVAGGLSTVVIGWSDAEGFIPLGHAFWFAKELVGGAYKTKQQLAQELILRHEEHILKYGIVMDGLYGTQDMITFLNERKIPFTTKMHSNRVVDHNGVSAQLENHPDLKLIRNGRGKTIKVTWKKFSLFVTVEKMKNRDGSAALRYLMSNTERTTQEYINLYWLRWPIEKFFRTAKQKLGFSQCQSTSIEKQNVHIFIVFYAFTKLQKKSVEFHFESVDEFIRYLRLAKFDKDDRPLTASDQIFKYYA
jgi:hypothetical protein